MSDATAPSPALSGVENVEPGALLARVGAIFETGARLVTCTCLDRGDRFEVLYHFDRELELFHLRVEVGKEQELPSISGVYLAAFLVENEMKELFGLNITGIAIDYRGRLYLTDESEPTPMAKEPRGPAA